MEMAFWYRDVVYPHIIKVPDQATAAARLTPGTMILVMPGDRPKSLKFLCPCGCGAVVSINLMPQAGKAWRARFDSGRGLSLFPSIWLDVGCKSHFIVRQNTA